MIHPFGLRDIRTIQELQGKSIAFDLQQQLLRPSSPLASALVGFVTNHHFGAFAWMLESSDKMPAGYIAVYPRSDTPCWDLASLSPSLESTHCAADAWLRLLTHATVHAGQRSIERIYARYAENSEIDELLRQVGYVSVSREELYVLVGRPSPVAAPRGVHKLDIQDLGALYQLYHDVMPVLVQQADAPETQWITRRHGQLSSFWSSQRWLWRDQERAYAYIGLHETRHALWLEIVVRPDVRAEIGPMVKYVLAACPAALGKAIYCQVPDYCAGISWILRSLGFEAYARQATMVLHVNATASFREPVSVSGLKKPADLRA